MAYDVGPAGLVVDPRDVTRRGARPMERVQAGNPTATRQVPCPSNR